MLGRKVLELLLVVSLLDWRLGAGLKVPLGDEQLGQVVGGAGASQLGAFASSEERAGETTRLRQKPSKTIRISS